MSLYIAPEGAMQFEVENRNSVQKKESIGAHLWVKAIEQGPVHSVRQRIGCTCKTFYKLLHCEPHGLWNGEFTVVCTCVGRIVE